MAKYRIGFHAQGELREDLSLRQVGDPVTILYANTAFQGILRDVRGEEYILQPHRAYLISPEGRRYSEMIDQPVPVPIQNASSPIPNSMENIENEIQAYNREQSKQFDVERTKNISPNQLELQLNASPLSSPKPSHPKSLEDYKPQGPKEPSRDEEESE